MSSSWFEYDDAPRTAHGDCATPSIECWDEESTANALRAFAMRLYSTGISLRETAAVFESIGVFRSHQAVFQ